MKTYFILILSFISLSHAAQIEPGSYDCNLDTDAARGIKVARAKLTITKDPINVMTACIDDYSYVSGKMEIERTSCGIYNKRYGFRKSADYNFDSIRFEGFENISYSRPAKRHFLDVESFENDENISLRLFLKGDKRIMPDAVFHCIIKD